MWRPAVDSKVRQGYTTKRPAASGSPRAGDIRMTAIEREEVSILKHMSCTDRDCGGGPTMDNLVAKGLMPSIGKAPDEFLVITARGRDALRGIRAAEIDSRQGSAPDGPRDKGRHMSRGASSSRT